MRFYNWVLVVIVFISFSFKAKEVNPEKDKLLIEIISYVLERGHYDPKEINDEFSEKVFEKYLKSIDGQHRFLYESDINKLSQYKFKIDDQIKNIKLDFFTLTHDIIIQRMSEVKSFYESLLLTPFSFDVEDFINLDFENQSYLLSQNELKKYWRKRFKLSTLDIFTIKKEEEKDIAEKDSLYILKTDLILEKESRKITLDNMKSFFENYDELERKDWFSIYVNSIVEQFDPHTFYFAPRDKDRFDASMSGKFEGIGARLQKKNQEVKIVEVISGGPVWRGKEVEVGDIILKVGQKNEEPIDISGMRLDNAVKLIKGPKGTIVFLTLKKVDGTISVISIERDVVELEETYAKSSLIKDFNNIYGIIELPKFYIDFKDYGERNAANDVKKELQQLKEKNVQGIILDLRNNGGGSLKAVIDMTGFFIKNGPVVQVKSTGGRKEILKDDDRSIIWDGPLVILVNEFSASASEIIAAALQDYKRAIVIGSKQTYGKGTVQNMVDLNRIVSSNTYGDLGALKVTTDKFYRVSGGSTQLEGVKSDIVFPDRYSYIDIGEKDQENPLSWDRISPADYITWDKMLNYESSLERSRERLKTNSFIGLIDEQAKWVKEQQDNYDYSLNYNSYNSKRLKNIEYSKRFDTLNLFKSTFLFQWLPEAGSSVPKDSVLIDRKKRWEESLKKDIYISEAVNILKDLSVIKTNDLKVTQIKK
jgi:carboxyl-terminal processing protease